MMNWKKTFFYFAYQTIKYGQDFDGFKKRWSYFDRWKRSMSPGNSSMSEESAWINFAAIDYLDQWLKLDHRVFEFGGGGSTLYFLKRAGFVSTVENHGEWFPILENAVKEKGYQHWNGFFTEGVPDGSGSTRFIENPLDYKSNVPQYAHLRFENYARCIEQYPEASFDVILVDGRARPSCIYHAIPRLKIGGLLVIDNNERPYYTTAFKDTFEQDFTVELDGRNVIPYIPDFVRTTILRRKKLA
jgi:hypothetical protein